MHCIELSENSNLGLPPIRPDIRAIIRNRYHFANNEDLVKAFRPVVDAIARLESRNSTIGDIFKEFLVVS